MTAQERRQRALLTREMPRLKHALGLDQWTIDLSFGPNPDTDRNSSARCAADARYKIAHIQFDLAQYASESNTVLLRDLLHELLHCLNSPMMTLCELLWKTLFEGTLESQNVSFERLPALLALLQRRKT